MINRMLFGEEILEAIFARSGMTFAELSKHFFRSPVGWEYHMSLINCLRSLSDASLIKVDGVKAEGTKEFISYCEYPNDWNEFHNTSAGPEQNKFRTSDEWRRIRGALTEGLQYGSSYRFVCLPSFGKPVFNHTPSPADIFVAMPFNPSMASVYEIIREAAAECNLTINRADEFSSSNPIIGEIWAAICSAKIVIADCSGKNPNVFYEIGMAHTVGKPVILITQKKEDIPFDVRHIRYMEYALNDAGRAELSRRIKDTLMCSLELYNRQALLQAGSDRKLNHVDGGHADSHGFCAVMGELDLAADDDGSGHHLAVLASATASHGLTETTGMFLELVGILSAESDSDAEAYFNTGLTWLATPVWQLDGGVRIGLTGASTDFTPFLGVSTKF